MACLLPERSGGGPDRQRWEQLKRFLGAERWQLEAILDDVLLSLLQIGLIIFCASLILYFRYLSPAISLIIGIPFSVGLASFIGSAICIIWDTVGSALFKVHFPIYYSWQFIPYPGRGG